MRRHGSRPPSASRRQPSSRARRRTTDDRVGGSNRIASSLLLGVALDTSGVLEALSDPTRAAQLLVRACAAVASRTTIPHTDDTACGAAEVEPSESGDGVTPVSAVVAVMADGDEDEDAERLEDENDDDDDDGAGDDDDDDDDGAGDDDDDDTHAYESSDELQTHASSHNDGSNNIDAITAALALATQVAEQLQLTLLQHTADASDALERSARHSTSLRTNERLSSTGGTIGAHTNEPGVPHVKARTVTNAQCMHCSKSFSAFHRSRHCTSCGYAFCVKCVSRRQILPTRFGYKDTAVRVCEGCCHWFQRALERYMDVMASSPTASSTALKSVTARRASVAGSASEQSPVLVPQASASGPLRRRQSRHSLAVPPPEAAQTAQAATQKSPPTKSWFTSHLLHKATNAEANDAPTGNTANTLENGQTAPLPITYERLLRSADSANGASDDNDDIFVMEPVLESIVKPADRHPATVTVVPCPSSNDAVSVEKPAPRLVRPRSTTKRSKFSRSASFDFTNLKSAASPSAATSSSATSTSTTAHAATNAVQSDGSDATASPTGSLNNTTTTTRLPRPKSKCFDDSDIVDSRAKSDAAGESATRNVDLPATVLRFAVYKVGGPKESPSLRRTLGFVGFGKANPVLDRYSLEVDCSQRIVRVKSVFQHRFWSFHCDAVTHFGFGHGEGRAQLVVHNGVAGAQSHELQFANDDEREEFKRAVETCRSTSLDAMRRASGARGASSNASNSVMTTAQATASPLQDASSSSSPVLDDVVAHGLLDSTLQHQPSGASSVDTNDSASSSSANANGMTTTTTMPTTDDVLVKHQLLAGEVVIRGSTFPSTLLLGPGGDSTEPSHVWGRIRGTVAVTTFRVLFVPAENCYVPLRTALQGSSPYIPLFAITFVQVLFPGGRRSKASRSYSTGLPSVLAVNCKDVRVMRVQLEGPPHVSDERSQHLANVIGKLADDAQRIKVVERPAFDALSLLTTAAAAAATTTSSPPSHDAALGTPPPPLPLSNSGGVRRSDSCDDASELSDDVQVSSSYVQSTLASYATTTRRAGPSNNSASPAPSPAPSPILRPGSPLPIMPSLPLEVSGAFASAYSVECPSPDVDGWNVFTDEREFKRQIGNDTSVHPFFKYYMNARGNICKTYPSKLLLPSTMNSVTLTKVTDFRAKNRLPVITYYHRRNRCVLTRSSQPLLGNLLSGSSSLSDQLLLGVYRRLPDIIRNQSIASASSRPIYIFDARKLKASTGNRLMGKGGVETPQDYPGAVVHHLNIANMYRMQSSFQSLVKLLLPGATDDSDKTWLLRVESTRWLHHLRAVLDGAMKIARVLELEGSSVLVHCSDGWDRTAQLTALAQLMIDPFFRTIRGFAVLVEKDWCAFGHKFAERLGSDRSKDPARAKSSPVMLQFLDAVWQIQRQFPYAFEFNERFLLHVANSLTSGLYGTFQFDSRLQRDTNNVRETTVSVWTPVLLNPTAFTNASFVHWDKPIWPWTGIQIMHLWEGYFLQWHPKYYNCHWGVANATSALATASTSTSTSTNSNSNGSSNNNVSGGATAAIDMSTHTSHSSGASPLEASVASYSRDGSFDSSDDRVTRSTTNLASPGLDPMPRSSGLSSRSSRASAVATVQVPKLPTRNAFMFRS